MRNIVASQLFEFARVIGDRHLINVTVGPHLDPVVLSLEQPPDYRKRRADRSNRFRIHHRIADDVWQSLDLPETEENFHHVQPLGENEWLLVRSLAQGNDDLNAHVYDAAGRHLRSFHAGDGTEDAQVTRGGEIWVSYFDEGVLSSTNLGQAGLVRLDGVGNCLFRFNDHAGGEVAGITDCYTLNVASDREVWLYYYTAFPLVKLRDGKVAGVWSNVPVRGSTAVAVAKGMAVFGGGYDNRESLYLIRLGSSRAQKLAPTDAEGRPLKGFSAFGRQDCVYLQTGDALYCVQVPEAHIGGPNE